MSIQQATIKFSEFKNTSKGPIAKIDGKWFSVNGNRQEIFDVRYALSCSEMAEYGVTNESLASLKVEVANKEMELRIIDSALVALREFYHHGLVTGVAYSVLESIMSSEQPLMDRAESVKDYIQELREKFNG